MKYFSPSLGIVLTVIAVAAWPGARQKPRQNPSSEGLVTMVSKLQTDVMALRAAVPPPGTILIWGGKQAPLGWLVCDGNPIPNVDENKALIRSIDGLWGKRDGLSLLPDFRGVFLRGAGVSGRPEVKDKNERAAGSFQADGIAKHQHTMEWKYADIHVEGGQANCAVSIFNEPGGRRMRKLTRDDSLIASEEADPGPASSSSLIEETRPCNVAVNYIIKL